MSSFSLIELTRRQLGFSTPNFFLSSKLRTRPFLNSSLISSATTWKVSRRSRQFSMPWQYIHTHVHGNSLSLSLSLSCSDRYISWKTPSSILRQLCRLNAEARISQRFTREKEWQMSSEIVCMCLLFFIPFRLTAISFLMRISLVTRNSLILEDSNSGTTLCNLTSVICVLTIRSKPRDFMNQWRFILTPHRRISSGQHD